MGPFLLSFQLKAVSPEPLRACVGGGGSAGGTGKQHPRGAKAPLSPRSEPASPEGNPATTSGAGDGGGGGGNGKGKDSPVPFPRGSSPLLGKPGQTGPCRTHGHGPTQKAARSPWDKDRPWGPGGDTDTHDNKGCEAFVLNPASVPSSGDRARCKALQSLKTITPFLASHRAQPRSPALPH